MEDDIYNLTEVNQYIPKRDKRELISIIGKWLIILLITIAVLWKFINVNIDMSKFDFSDLLALILAIFSIWLSVAFYYKATDTSNLFYDNTYKFTKDISIILGRIEAGFGEKLKHIDEGYKEISGRIYSNVGKEEKVAELEEALQKSEAEKKQQIIDFANRSKLAEKDKEEFLNEIRQRDIELKERSLELQRLRRQSSKSDFDNELQLKVQNHLLIIYNRYTPQFEVKTRVDSIKLFDKLKREMDPQALDDMRTLGFVQSDRSLLTRSGAEFINRTINSA